MSQSIVMTEQEIIHTQLQHIIEMLDYREMFEHINNKNKFIKDTVSQLHKQYNNSLVFNFTFKMNDGKTKRVNIKFVKNSISNLKKTPGLEEFLNKSNDLNILINEPAPRAIELMKHYKNLEIFQNNYFNQNKAKADYVPYHKLLTPKERDAFYAEYKNELANLPIIQLSDPMAKYVGGRLRDVIKIVRASSTSGRSIIYRRVA